MDDREFSSPVCYLDYDNEQSDPSEPAPLCERCKGFVAGFNSSWQSSNRGTYSDVKICEATIELETISKPKCFLCRRFFKNVADFPQEMTKLNNGASVTVDYFYRIAAGHKFILLYFQGPKPQNNRPRRHLSSLTVLDHSSGV
jgi:hypothetical protein